MNDTGGRGAREAFAAFAIHLALAVAATWPLVLHGADRVLGHVELESTPRLNAWAMAWVRHQLVRDPVHLFDANAFHPYRRTLAFSEHMLVPSLMGAPFAAVAGDVVAYNAVTLLTFALSGLGAFLLARELVASRTAALLAGVLYAFSTWNLNEVVRLQILSNEWFPFLVWSLLRFFDRPTRARAAGAGLFYALQALSCMYWALYLPLLVGPLLAFLQWRRRLPARSLAPLLLALAVAFAALVPFALPYVRSAHELGLQRSPPEPLAVGRYLDVLPGNLLYERWLGTAGRNQNAAHFPGFAALALAAWGAARGGWRPGRAQLRPLWIGLAAAGFVLSLGPALRVGDRLLAPAPYALLFEWMPGFRNVRYPERFALFFVLGLAPLAAAGLTALRGRLGRAGSGMVVAFAFVEHLALPNVLTPMPSGAAVPAADRWAAGEADVRVVAEVPCSRHRMERLDALPMWLSTAHWKRTLQGFTGYLPPTYNFAKWRLFHFPAPESVRFLERFGVDTVLVKPSEGAPPAWWGPDPRWHVVGPFADGGAALRLIHAGRNPYAPPADDRRDFVEVTRTGWDVQASNPGAERAVDGDDATVWQTGGDAQGRGDFYRIRFATPVEIDRVSIAVRHPYEFPLRLKLLGQTESDWVELPYDVEAAYDGLFAGLLHRPQDAWLDLDVAPRRVSAIRLRIGETDAFWMPWTMAEVRVFKARSSVPP